MKQLIRTQRFGSNARVEMQIRMDLQYQDLERKRTSSEDVGMECEAAERRVPAGRAAGDEQSLAVGEALRAEPEGASAAVREIVDAPPASRVHTNRKQL